MKDESIISILYDLKNKGIGIIIIIIAVMTFFFIRNDYKDKHDECKIYQNNLKAKLTLDKVLSIDTQEMSVYISYLSSNSNKYLRLNETFIDSVQVGDSIHKFRGENIVTIYRGEKKIRLPFAQVPYKECK